MHGQKNIKNCILLSEYYVSLNMNRI